MFWAKFKFACYARSHEAPFHRHRRSARRLHPRVCGGLFSTEDQGERRLEPPGKGGRTDRSRRAFALCIPVSFRPKCSRIRWKSGGRCLGKGALDQGIHGYRGRNQATSPPRNQGEELWDDQYLYVAAHLEEPDLWATYDEHDMIVFHENDFEVFVDPDGDGREYYEIEINVIGTIFDLFLHRPYREGGPAEHGWHASGMKTAIHTNGTVNNPLDRDESWVVEMAIPWSDFSPPTTRMDGTPWVLPPIREHLRGAGAPRDGETWRINFSRVHWDLQVVDDVYEKVPDRPEYNWTWTPQWEINMHVPEHWGFLEFTKEESSS